MKNKRILKIFLFSILIVASLVTYLSYGVKEKTTTSSLNLENNKSDFTNILMEKSILLSIWTTIYSTMVSVFRMTGE